MSIKNSFLHSIVLRVVLVFFIFVVIPIIVHSFILYKRSYEKQFSYTLNVLEMWGHADRYGDDESVKYSKIILAALSRRMRSTAELNEIVTQENLYSAFVVQKNEKGQYIIVAGTRPEILGKESLFSKDLPTIKPNTFAFQVAYDPIEYTLLDFGIFTPNGTDFYMVSQLTKGWFYSEIKDLKIKPPYYVTLLRHDGKVLLSTDPNFSVAQTEIIDSNQFSKLKDKILSSKKKYIALKNDSIASNYALIISFDREAVRNQIFHTVFFQLFWFLFFYVFIAGVIVAFFIKKLQRPQQEFYRTMQQVKGGDLKARYTKQFLGFEINHMGAFFNETVDQLVQVMKKEYAERVEKEVFKKELLIAQEVQYRLFPENLSRIREIDISARFIPAKIVGGDFYDAYEQGEDVLFLIADASGKGVSASMLSLTVRSYFRSHFSRKCDLQQMIATTNQLFLEDTKERGDFVTAFIAIYHKPSHHLTYSSMGHNPSYIKRKNGALEKITTLGMALGVAPFDRIEVKSTLLNPGDLLFMYSDGLSDSLNEAREFYSIRRLEQFLAKEPVVSADSVAQHIIDSVRIFSENEVQYDDITLLTVIPRPSS